MLEEMSPLNCEWGDMSPRPVFDAQVSILQCMEEMTKNELK